MTNIAIDVIHSLPNSDLGFRPSQDLCTQFETSNVDMLCWRLMIQIVIIFFRDVPVSVPRRNSGNQIMHARDLAYLIKLNDQ